MWGQAASFASWEASQWLLVQQIRPSCVGMPIPSSCKSFLSSNVILSMHFHVRGQSTPTGPEVHFVPWLQIAVA